MFAKPWAIRKPEKHSMVKALKKKTTTHFLNLCLILIATKPTLQPRFPLYSISLFSNTLVTSLQQQYKSLSHQALWAALYIPQAGSIDYQS